MRIKNSSFIISSFFFYVICTLRIMCWYVVCLSICHNIRKRCLCFSAGRILHTSLINYYSSIFNYTTLHRVSIFLLSRFDFFSVASLFFDFHSGLFVSVRGTGEKKREASKEFKTGQPKSFHILGVVPFHRKSRGGVIL